MLSRMLNTAADFLIRTLKRVNFSIGFAKGFEKGVISAVHQVRKDQENDF